MKIIINDLHTNIILNNDCKEKYDQEYKEKIFMAIAWYACGKILWRREELNGDRTYHIMKYSAKLRYLISLQ
jgi:hypothetical protein